MSVCIKEAALVCGGRLFHARAAATGNARHRGWTDELTAPATSASRQSVDGDERRSCIPSTCPLKAGAIFIIAALTRINVSRTCTVIDRLSSRHLRLSVWSLAPLSLHGGDVVIFPAINHLRYQPTAWTASYNARCSCTLPLQNASQRSFH